MNTIGGCCNEFQVAGYLEGVLLLSLYFFGQLLLAIHVHLDPRGRSLVNLVFDLHAGRSLGGFLCGLGGLLGAGVLSAVGVILLSATESECKDDYQHEHQCTCDDAKLGIAVCEQALAPFANTGSETGKGAGNGRQRAAFFVFVAVILFSIHLGLDVVVVIEAGAAIRAIFAVEGPDPLGCSSFAIIDGSAQGSVHALGGVAVMSACGSASFAGLAGTAGSAGFADGFTSARCCRTVVGNTIVAGFEAFVLVVIHCCEYGRIESDELGVAHDHIARIAMRGHVGDVAVFDCLQDIGTYTQAFCSLGKRQAHTLAFVAQNVAEKTLFHCVAPSLFRIVHFERFQSFQFQFVNENFTGAAAIRRTHDPDFLQHIHYTTRSCIAYGEAALNI